MTAALTGASRAVFLDKDGTLIHDVPYNVSVDHIRFRDEAFTALRLLRDAGFLIVVVTNQSGVARGLFTEDEVLSVGDFLASGMQRAGVTLDGFYYCPHHPDGLAPVAVDCRCRKPMPGML
jgi:D-glycero-D-manno-heptose 1,7-bisphosphate phosphatase